MNEFLFYGLTWLLLPSVVRDVGAAHFRSQLYRRQMLPQPIEMRVTPHGETFGDLEEKSRSAEHDATFDKPDFRQSNPDKWGEFQSNVHNRHEEKSYVKRFKRQPTLPTTMNFTITTEPTTTTMKTPAPPSDAVVLTRPDLIHPAFTTYLFSVTLPCVIAWVFVTWLCLWICRPHSPLYREILKRLIEHSQMKQKSVLFAATVLAGERKPPEDPAAEPTTSTK